MSAAPKGHTAVMAARADTAREAPDDFPTPPWATRALTSHVLPRLPGGIDQTHTILEPACGRRIMANVLRETFEYVEAFDAHDYGCNEVGNFLPMELGYRKPHWPPDWVITNPPFKLAQDFVEEATHIARVGVCMLMRLAFMEGKDRYHLFRCNPFAVVAPFAERVPMVEGRWDPDASSATVYAWFVWLNTNPIDEPRVRPIPPGCRKALTRPDDVARYASRLYQLGCPGKAEGLARKLFGSEQAALDWWHTDDVLAELSPDQRTARALSRIEDLRDAAAAAARRMS